MKTKFMEGTVMALEEFFHCSWILTNHLKLLKTTGKGDWRPMLGGYQGNKVAVQ